MGEYSKQGLVNNQFGVKFMEQKEFNANIVKRLEELEDFKAQALIRLDQEIENRTKAFELIEDIQDDIRMIKEYSIDGLKEGLRELAYNTDIKFETIDDTLVVHRNQNDTQRKNHASLIKVWDEKVIPLIEGTHGKEE
jgi:hypothetical protein